MNLVRKTTTGAAIAIALAGTSALYAQSGPAKGEDKAQHAPGMMMQGGGMMGMMNMMSQMSQMMESCNKMMQGMSMQQPKETPPKQKE